MFHLFQRHAGHILWLVMVRVGNFGSRRDFNEFELTVFEEVFRSVVTISAGRGEVRTRWAPVANEQTAANPMVANLTRSRPSAGPDELPFRDQIFASAGIRGGSSFYHRIFWEWRYRQFEAFAGVMAWPRLR
jgi:hypothetical protein